MAEELADALAELDIRIGRRRRHEEIQRERRGEDADKHPVAGGQRQAVHDERAADGSEEDRQQREQLDRAVGLHQALARQDLRKDAVFGRSVERGPDAHDEVPDGLPRVAEPDAQAAHQRAEQLEQVAAAQPRGLGVAVVEVAGERREQHVRDEQDARVDRAPLAQLFLGDLAGLLHQGELADDDGEDGVVAESPEELARQQQGVIAGRSHGRTILCGEGVAQPAPRARTEISGTSIDGW